MHLYFQFFLFLLFLFCTFKESGIEKLTEWSTIPACPSLMCFSTRAVLKGLVLRKIMFTVFDVCVRVLSKFVSALIFFLDFREFVALWLVCRMYRRKIEVFSPDIILCGSLGSKYYYLIRDNG